MLSVLAKLNREYFGYLSIYERRVPIQAHHQSYAQRCNLLRFSQIQYGTLQHPSIMYTAHKETDPWDNFAYSLGTPHCSGKPACILTRNLHKYEWLRSNPESMTM